MRLTIIFVLILTADTAAITHSDMLTFLLSVRIGIIDTLLRAGGIPITSRVYATNNTPTLRTGGQRKRLSSMTC